MKSIAHKLFSLALFLSTALACQDDSNGTDGALPTQPGAPIPQKPEDAIPVLPANNNPPAASPSLTEVACDNAWVNYVAAHPVGLVLSYERTTEVTGGLLQDGHVTTTNEQTVTAADISHVSFKSSQASTIDGEVTREAFVKACLSNDSIQASGLQGFTLQEKKKDSITVKAGTFEADHAKGSLTTEAFGQSIVSQSEAWIATDDRKALLKLISTSEPVAGTTTKVTIELISIRQP